MDFDKAFQILSAWKHASAPTPEAVELEHAYRDALAECQRLSGLINTPETEDFLRAVQLEAAHQLERWGEDDRSRKDDLDWIWLITFLTGKVRWGKTSREPGKGTRAEALAYATQMAADQLTGIPAVYAEDGREKYLHRIVTIAAAALNWHRNRWPGHGPEGFPDQRGTEGTQAVFKVGQILRRKERRASIYPDWLVIRSVQHMPQSPGGPFWHYTYDETKEDGTLLQNGRYCVERWLVEDYEVVH